MDYSKWQRNGGSFFGCGCLHGNMPLAKILQGRRGSARQSVWSSADFGSPMGSACRVPRVLLDQA